MAWYFISVWLLAMLAGAVFLWCLCGPDDQKPLF